MIIQLNEQTFVPLSSIKKLVRRKGAADDDSNESTVTLIDGEEIAVAEFVADYLTRKAQHEMTRFFLSSEG